MDEAAEDVVTLNASDGRTSESWLGNLEQEPPVWPLLVVVTDVGAEYVFGLALRDDEQVVEAFGPQARDPGFG